MEIDTVVKDGGLDLAVPLPYPEGTAVHVVIELKSQVLSSEEFPDPQEAARLLQEIAEMPRQGPGGFCNRDHDSVPYSREANP